MHKGNRRKDEQRPSAQPSDKIERVKLDKSTGGKRTEAELAGMRNQNGDRRRKSAKELRKQRARRAAKRSGCKSTQKKWRTEVVTRTAHMTNKT
jgi:hypothetical protein